ncbi:MAG: hypothetical protein HKM24_00505 [Gammaproteobacteria bacterium]|nr:hypothetical protein [Gammaproteobacteria bacterium]
MSEEKTRDNEILRRYQDFLDRATRDQQLIFMLFSEGGFTTPEEIRESATILLQRDVSISEVTEAVELFVELKLIDSIDRSQH